MENRHSEPQGRDIEGVHFVASESIFLESGRDAKAIKDVLRKRAETKGIVIDRTFEFRICRAL